ncbi:CRISPR-associated helicase Cas3' [Spiractinospora alimapuensis]|uniref:CRISPR-associated helicase Cas3' n=1 Tax=Spiractinospora alimapuensis TaxID=2820884 RepID=UPI001F185A26|nr:CRISPR-associated helicase Cas3' [Spiractinospora alimapuensis]QVQ51593.1 CRISPR-associated helicase Cas3' [Spiractinospora alimapuensis]
MADTTPIDICAPWGKAGKAKTPKVHLLICHAIDAAAFAEELVDLMLGPRLREELEEAFTPLGGKWQRWVAFWCGLHDLGKFSPYFQSVRTDVTAEYFDENAQKAISAFEGRAVAAFAPHSLLTASHLDWELKRKNAPRPTRRFLTGALAGHHGYFPNWDGISQMAPKRLGKKEWCSARQRFVRELAALWELDFDQDWSHVHIGLRGAIGIAGLTVMCDRLASDHYTNRIPRHAHMEKGTAAYRDEVRHKARDTLRRLNWHPWEHRTPPRYRGLFNGEPPRRLHTLVEEVLDDNTQPGIMVIEAPTGEGKSRAGLLASAMLVDSLGLTGFMLALPTRALSRTQLHDLNAVLADAEFDLRGLPAFSGAMEDMPRLAKDSGIELNPQDTAEDVARDPNQERNAQRRSKPDDAILSPLVVGTHDRAQMTVINAKWVHLRIAAMSNKVLVIDEAHACDTYVASHMDKLMWWCGSIGTPVVVMSASLSKARRDALITHWQAGARLEEGPVETTTNVESGWQITWASADEDATAWPLESLEAPQHDVELVHHSDDFEKLAREIFAHISNDGCALVLLNTKRRVDRAHEVFRRVADEVFASPPEIVSVHSDREDRAESEARISELLGKNSPTTRHAVAIGTSLLESGVDLDADILASDPTMIDLLIQRIGRLHRHARPYRPGATRQQTLLLLDKDRVSKRGTDPHDDERGFPDGIANVYPALLLRLTRVALRDRSRLNLPEEAPALLRMVYGDSELWTLAASNRKQWERDLLTYMHRTDHEDYLSTIATIPLLAQDQHLSRLTEHAGPVNRTRKPDGRNSRQEGTE